MSDDSFHPRGQWRQFETATLIKLLKIGNFEEKSNTLTCNF